VTGRAVVEIAARFLSWLLFLVTFPLSLVFCVKVVQEYERAVIFSLGRLKSAGSHGIFFLLPCLENFVKVDLRTTVLDVPPQEILTKDSVTVKSSTAQFSITFSPSFQFPRVNNPSFKFKFPSAGDGGRGGFLPRDAPHRLHHQGRER
jgi:SPFH domain / Band 7 family